VGEEVDILLVGVVVAGSITQMAVVAMAGDHKIITNKAAIILARAVVDIPRDTIKVMETLIKADIAAAGEIEATGEVVVRCIRIISNAWLRRLSRASTTYT